MQLTIDSRIKLNDGASIPRLGFGVWQIPAGRVCETAVLDALEAGYRHIDTAAIYGNEESVGRAIRQSGISRDEIYVTTKLWNDHHAEPVRALNGSLRRLGFDYVDLYLIHYPVKERVRTWSVLDRLREEGTARSIGVSNFTIRHLKELLATPARVPAIDQVELHPYLYQRELLDFCASQGIVVQSYSPLTHGQRLNDPKLAAIARMYSKDGRRSPAQILIRWALQLDVVVIPKASKRSHIFENADVFDFEISAGDMETLNGFHEDLRTCWDPTDAR